MEVPRLFKVLKTDSDGENHSEQDSEHLNSLSECGGHHIGLLLNSARVFHQAD